MFLLSREHVKPISVGEDRLNFWKNLAEFALHGNFLTAILSNS